MVPINLLLRIRSPGRRGFRVRLPINSLMMEIRRRKRLLNCPSSAGMVQVKFRLGLRFPSSEGMVPLNSLLGETPDIADW